MQIFGMALFILMIFATFALLSFAIYKAVKLVKSPTPKIINWQQETKTLILIGIGHALAFFLMTIGIYLWQKISPNAGEWAATVIGGILFPASFYVFLMTFIVHYYGKELPVNFNKWLYRSLIISIPVVLVMLFVWTDGFANYISYPLPKGISFTKGLVRNGANIAFYALFILSGALFVYFLCDHKFYVQYGVHGKIESTFLVAFPAGILGARIAYVIGEWNTNFAARFAKGEWWSIFAIWEGGLTILGGAIAGIVVGVLWFMWRNKGYSIWVAVDIIVPTILIAQAIGRWGNFFNCEVYGQVVDEKYWSWLPTIIFKQIHYDTNGLFLGNQVVVPLFLIESITNMIGYFILAGLFGKCLRKYTELGDLAFGYIIWYGLTRVVMEPLRNSTFQMGSDKYWSWFWSLIFVLAGSMLIVANHFVRYLLKKKKGDLVPQQSWLRNGLIGGGITLAITIAFISVGAILMINNPSDKSHLVLDGYNNGLILLIIGCSLLLGSLIYVPHTLEGYKAVKARA